MSPRRDIPPLEIMKRPSRPAEPSWWQTMLERRRERRAADDAGRTDAGAASTPADGGEPGAVPGGGGGGSGGSADPGAWMRWAGGGPLVLRIPPGVAIAAAAGLLLLLLLAYGLGTARGKSVAEAGYAEQQRELASQQERPVPERPQGGSSVDANDPRAPGYYYLRLTRYPPDAAAELAAFLARNDVATYRRTEGDGRFQVVYAVDYYFPDPTSEAANAYERQMRQLGAAWQRRNNGLGDALETMYYARYEAEP